MWWVSNPQRLAKERDELAKLVEDCAEVRILRWQVRDNLGLAVEAEVAVGDAWQPLTLTYPEFFPSTAPEVTPTDGVRLSGHQYGQGGELCLEIRPDNWEPAFTGAMMLASAVKLLRGEAAGPGAPPLPSAHASTLGQRARGRMCRFLLSPDVVEQLAAMGDNTALPLTASEQFVRDGAQFLARVRSVGSGESAWRDATVGEAGCALPGFLVRVPDLAALPAIRSVAEAEAALAGVGNDDLVRSLRDPENATALVIGDGSSARFWSVFTHDGQRQLLLYLTIDMLDDRSSRLPSSYSVLPGKRIGLVGCGSLGSKIAGSLARAGVNSFVLVDDDIVTLGTLVRQDYSVDMVGAHKVDALHARLKSINPAVKVVARRVKLGGQEAANVTSSVLEQLAECDIIVDATANPKVFNLCGAVAKARRKPMVWAEVLAGGIGGFVGRARPDQDPVPHAIRRQLAHWCENQGVRWPPAGTREYEAIVDGEPMLADDADVAVIAAHAARFILDLLSLPGRSRFPHSLYAVGMAGDWAFSEPFDTHPIALEGTEGWGEMDAENAADTIAQALEILHTVLPKRPEPDEPPAAA
jgi:hypothetical protein